MTCAALCSLEIISEDKHFIFKNLLAKIEDCNYIRAVIGRLSAIKLCNCRLFKFLPVEVLYKLKSDIKKLEFSINVEHIFLQFNQAINEKLIQKLKLFIYLNWTEIKNLKYKYMYKSIC